MLYDERIAYLIYRRLIGTATPDEDKSLEEWLDADEANRQFYSRISDIDMLREEIFARSVVDYERPAHDMMRLVNARRRSRTMRRVMSAAAVIAVISVIGAVLYFNLGSDIMSVTAEPYADNLSEEAVCPLSIDSITAGSMRATITDSSGRTIALSADSPDSGRGIDMLSHHSEDENLCLEVPRGGEFKVILEDSTEVWLNSESSIRYPETFGPDERRVAVSGEVYFHVKKDQSRPFYVETDKQIIRVYGTSFNIRAYPDEDATFTTLETGSISLRKSTDLSGEIFLSKGHQAVLDHRQDELRLRVVDPEVVTSWRHGRFVFDEQPLERIMRDLSRWYDFQYEFADELLRTRVFMGSVHRYADFRTVIQILENCGGIRFTVSSDNKILISSV